MRALLPLIFLLSVSCAVGPTPERIGFDYPEAGLKFNPRRHVTSETVRGQVATVANPQYEIIFLRTRCEIENPDTRLLVSGIKGSLTENRLPLYDDIALKVYMADPTYDFELVDEENISLDWSGLVSDTGILRTWTMTPVGGGETTHAFAVIVEHYGNTIEIMWRDAAGNAPGEAELEKFEYWTYGLRFYEPEVEGE